MKLLYFEPATNHPPEAPVKTPAQIEEDKSRLLLSETEQFKSVTCRPKGDEEGKEISAVKLGDDAYAVPVIGGTTMENLTTDQVLHKYNVTPTVGPMRDDQKRKLRHERKESRQKMIRQKEEAVAIAISHRQAELDKAYEKIINKSTDSNGNSTISMRELRTLQSKIEGGHEETIDINDGTGQIDSYQVALAPFNACSANVLMAKAIDNVLNPEYDGGVAGNNNKKKKKRRNNRTSTKQGADAVMISAACGQIHLEYDVEDLEKSVNRLEKEVVQLNKTIKDANKLKSTYPDSYWKAVKSDGKDHTNDSLVAILRLFGMKGASKKPDLKKKIVELDLTNIKVDNQLKVVTSKLAKVREEFDKNKNGLDEQQQKLNKTIQIIEGRSTSAATTEAHFQDDAEATRDDDNGANHMDVDPTLPGRRVILNLDDVGEQEEV